MTIYQNINNFMEPVHHPKSNNRLERHNAKLIKYKAETTSHLGLKIWNLLPEEYKEIVYIKNIEKFIIYLQKKKFKLETSRFYLTVYFSSHRFVHARNL